MELKSSWNVFIGIAVEDKAYDSRLLKVHCVELTPFISGELKDLTGKETFEIFNKDKDALEKNDIVTTNSIVCEYFGFSTNRTFPPDIRKGEQVLVVKYADADKWYWISLGRDDKLRKKEILRFAVANSDDIEKDLDEENTYFIELDTLHNKRIRLVTSKSDDEEFKYSIIVDAKNNFVSILDDIGNEIILESAIPRIKLKNSDNTIIDLNKKNIVMIGEDVIIRAKRNFILKAVNEYREIQEVSQLKALKTTIDSIGGVNFITPILDMAAASLRVAGTVESPLFVGAAFTTGPLSPPTIPGTVDYASGLSENNAPNTPTGNIGTPVVRSASAWEQVNAALAIIQACLVTINGHPEITLPPDHTQVAALGIASIMPLNKGV